MTAPPRGRRCGPAPALAAVAAVLACAAAAGAVHVAHADGEAIAVVNYNIDLIQVFHPASTLNFTFGSTGTDDGQFNAPRAVDFHPYGIIAVADRENHNVQVFHPNDTFAFKIGSTRGCGNGQLNEPSGVAVGPGGTIAVGNAGCHNVQVFHPNGTHAFTIGTGRGAGSGQFDGLRGVDFGPGGMIAVADRRNERVQVFHPDGTLALGFGTRGNTDGQFLNPIDVAFLAGGGFVVADSTRHDVQIFDAAGAYVSKVGTTGMSGPGNNVFQGPQGVAAGPGGLFAVADTGNNRIRVFDSGRALTYTIASGSGNGAFDHPQGVAFGPADAHNAAVLVSGVSSPDGVYLGGSDVNITVRFTAPVEVEGQPRLALSTWPPRNATLVDGNGTDGLVFRYAVQEGDVAADLDYMGMASLLLEGGLGDIRPASGAAGTASPVLPHPGSPGSLGASSDVVVVQRVRVAGVTTSNADATYGAGQEIRIRISFSEAVDVRGTPLLHLATVPPRAAAYVDGSDGDAEIEFLYTVRPGETALRLAYNGTGALSLPPGSAIVASAGGHDVVLLGLPDPGSEGSLSHSSRITIDSSAPAGPSGHAAPPAPVILTPPAAVALTPHVVRGTAAPGGTVVLYNNMSQGLSAPADSVSGWWSAPVALSEGLNRITATATLAGETSPPSPPVAITLDTTPPPVPVILNTDGEAAPSRAHVVRGSADPGAFVEVRVNSTLGGSTPAHWETGLWRVLVMLGPGDNSVTARALDGLGNPSDPATVRIVGPGTTAPSTTLGNPTHVSSIQDRQDEVLLVAPRNVKAFESGNRAYAMVAAGGSSVVQIVDFTDPRAPKIAGTIPNADGRNLALPHDIELFTANNKRIAAVTSLSSHGIELIDVSDPLNPDLSLTGSASYRDIGADHTSRFPQLLGARDADAFTATVNGTAGTYLVVVSDFSHTSIGPGGFQIVNVTHPGSPTPVYSNHHMAANGTGHYVMSRPPSETPLGPGSNPSSWTLSVADPRIIAVFDGDGDPVAKTYRLELPGYGRSFSVPIEGLYASDLGPDPEWSIGLNTVIETRNSTGHTISATRNGEQFEFPDACSRADPCTGQYNLIMLHTSDTQDPGDDYIIEVYGNDILGTYSYPVAKLVGGKMLSVGLDGEPFRLKGLDADGNRFEVLDGAASVDTFESSGGTYAVVAARDDDGVQIINLTDPTSPRAVAAVRDGEADGASGMFGELDGAAGVGIASVGGGTYAVVAARDDDGVQIINLTDPASPRATSSVSDEQGASRNKFSMLDGAIGVHVFEQVGRTYAIVSAEADNGFQVIDITDPARPLAADRGHDGSMCSTAARYSTLAGAIASDTLAFGGRLYAVIAANFDYGVQVVDITDPERLVVLGAVTDDPGGFTELHEPIAAESVEIGGATYVLVASYKGRATTAIGDDTSYGTGDGGGVQIIEVSDPASPRAAAALGHTEGPPFNLLHGPRGIDTFAIGARTYAIITAESTPGYSDSDGRGSFMIVDITRPEAPRFVSGVRDGQPDANGRKFDMLNAPAGVETARIGDKTYAVIAARGPWLPGDGDAYNGPHGVQIVDVSRPARPLAVASIQDGGTDASGGTFETLQRAHGVDTVQIGSKWYALVASIRDDGVQVIEITDPSSPKATASIADSADRGLGGANTIKAFKAGGKTYAVVASKHDITPPPPSGHPGALQMLNITNPASPDSIDLVQDDLSRPGGRFSEINHVYGIDTFVHNGGMYAITTCEEARNLDVSSKHSFHNTVANQACSGVQIIDMRNPAEMRPGGTLWNKFDTHELLGARGVTTFTAKGSVHAAVAGFQDDGVEIVRLATGTDTSRPAVVSAELNQERGILRITFDEPVKTSGNFNLGLITIRNATGSAVPVQLTGASLSGVQGGALVEIALTEPQRRGAAAFASPRLAFTSAGAFQDLSGNSLPVRTGVEAEIVTSRPDLIEATLDLGTGVITLAFTEAVNSSGLDLSKIAVYTPDDPQVRYFPSESLTGDGNSEISVRLGAAARQSVAGLAGAPVLDLLDGAVGSSTSGRPSVEQRGVVFMPLLADRVDPVLHSAQLSGRNLTLAFSEHVNVGVAAFRLDRMYMRDLAGGGEFSLAGADILTTVNATHVLVRLNATQAADAASYADPVLELRLDGPFGAVQDLSGQGIGSAAVAVSRAAGDGSGFSARATAPDAIRVSFGTEVTASATDPGTTWILGGPDAGDLEVSEYGAVRGAASVVLGLSGNLSSTRPHLTLEYAQEVGDIAGAGGGAEIAGAVVPVSDGIAPRIESARITDGLNAAIRYSERVSAPHAAYDSVDVLGGEAAQPSTLASGNETETHVITLGQFVDATNATGAVVINPGLVVDVDGNALGAGPVQHRQALEDGRPPEVALAEITGGNTLAVRYGEPVTATREAYAAVGITIGNTVRNAESLDGGSGTDLHLVTFGGDAVPPGTGAGNVTINGMLVHDLAAQPANRLGDRNLTVQTTDGRPVAILSARVTGPGTVTVLYDDHGVAPQRYTGLSIDGRDRDAVPRTASAGEVAVEFTPDTVRPNSTGWIIIDGANHTVGDGQAPSVANATAVSRSEIRVAFDEPVNATDANDGAGGWAVSGTDSGGSTVESRRGISPASAELVLTLGGGGLASDRPLGVMLGYDGAAGALITDPAGNRLPGASVAVSDGIAPRMAWAGITGGNEATIRYSENVSAPNSAYERVEVPEGSDDRASSIKSGNGTATHVISFGEGYVAATNATGIVVLGAALAVDASGNAADPGTYRLQDGRPPEVASANVSAGNTLTVNYTEPVLALAGAYTDIVIDNVPRTLVGSPAGNGTDSHEIMFSGNAVRPGADGRLSISNALVLDLATPQPYPLAGELENLRIPHGHVPLLYSAKITGNGTAIVEYSKGVRAPQSAYAQLEVYGLMRAIQAPFGGNGSRMHTIQFTPADAPPNATGSVSIDLSAVVDSAGTPVGSATATQDLADGQAPSVANATAVSLSAILVRFSEPVNATTIGGAGGWSVGGGDASELAVLSASDISGGHDRLTLTLDDNFSSTAPAGVEVSYDTTGGLVTDAGGNVLSAEPTPVADGIAPRIERATITGPDNATIWYTEPVSSPTSPYQSLTLRPGGPDVLGGNSALLLSDTHTVFLNVGVEGAAAPNATGTLAITAFDILDAAGNPLGAGVLRRDLADGQRPVVLSAAVRNATSVLVAYNEPVSAPVRAYSGLSLGDGMSRTFTGLEENLTAGHVVVFGGAPAPEDSTGTVTIDETAVFDLADPPNPLGDDDERDIALGDDTRPPVRLSANVTGPETITVRYSRAVTAPESAYASVTVGGVPRSVSGLGGSGSAVHEITFAPAGAPPNATGSMLVNETAVRSMGGGPLETGPSPANWTLLDGQNPSIVRAEAVVLQGGMRDTMRVVFDEPVMDGSTGDYGADGWSAAGGDMGPRSVSSRDAIAAGSTELVLRLDGALPDDSPSGILLAYDAGADAYPVVDESGNPLGSVSSRAVDDGIAPNLTSASITADRTVAVSYSEPVDALQGAYAEILLGNGTIVGIAGVVDSGTAEHTITLDGSAAPIPRGMRAKIVVNASAVLDAAARPNSLGDGNVTRDLSEERDTTVVSSSVTGPGSLTVRFSAAAAAFEYGTLFVEGMMRTPAGHMGGGTAEHVILFEPANASSSATGWFTIDPRAVFVGPENLTLSDGQAPGIEGATAVSLNMIRVVFDEAVTGSGSGAGGWSVSGDDTGAGLSVSSRQMSSGDPSALVLALDGDLRDTLPDAVLLSYDNDPGSVMDAAGNDLGPVSPMPVGDGIAPNVLSAAAVSLTEIRVEFSEPVNASGMDGAGWSVSGGDADGLAVDSGSDISDPSDTLNLALSGPLPDTAPDNVLLSYDPGTGDAADQAGNALGQVGDHGVDDGIAPEIRSALITGPMRASVMYSEPVAAGQSAYAVAKLDGESSSRTVTPPPVGSEIPVHTLALDGPDAAANATGTLTMDQTMLSDAAGNMLGSNTSFAQALSDGQRPRIKSALITGDNAVAITYTEPVGAPPSAYSNLTLDPGGARNITSVADNDTAVHVLAFDGGAAVQGAEGRIAVNGAAVLDRADPPNALGGNASLAQDVFDGRFLQIVSAKVSGPGTAIVQYSRPAMAEMSDYTSLVVGGQVRMIDSLDGGRGRCRAHPGLFRRRSGGAERHRIRRDKRIGRRGLERDIARRRHDQPGAGRRPGSLRGRHHGRLADRDPGGIRRARKRDGHGRHRLVRLGRRRGRPRGGLELGHFCRIDPAFAVPWRRRPARRRPRQRAAFVRSGGGRRGRRGRQRPRPALFDARRRRDCPLGAGRHRILADRDHGRVQRARKRVGHGRRRVVRIGRRRGRPWGGLKHGHFCPVRHDEPHPERQPARHGPRQRAAFVRPGDRRRGRCGRQRSRPFLFDARRRRHCARSRQRADNGPAQHYDRVQRARRRGAVGVRRRGYGRRVWRQGCHAVFSQQQDRLARDHA